MTNKYQRAEEKYIELISFLKKMIVVGNGKLDKGQYATVLSHLDAIIQAILLYVAMEEGELSENAKDFITGLTINGDFLKALNSVGKRKLYARWTPLTWDNIGMTGVSEDYRESIFRTALMGEVADFTQPFAFIFRDISSKDYINRISERIPGLIKAVCLADDEDPSKEDLRRRIGRGVQLYEDVVRNRMENF